MVGGAQNVQVVAEGYTGNMPSSRSPREVAEYRQAAEVRMSLLSVLDDVLGGAQGGHLIFADIVVHGTLGHQPAQDVLELFRRWTEPGMRRCIGCGLIWPDVTEHYPALAHTKGRRWVNKCRACRAAYSRAWRAEPGNGPRTRYRRPEDPLRRVAANITSSARARAQDKGLPFDPDIVNPSRVYAWLRRAARCACCGVDLDVVTIKDVNHRASLDRIRPDLGYVAGNVAVVCFRCNRIKGDATPEELERVAAWIRSVS